MRRMEDKELTDGLCIKKLICVSYRNKRRMKDKELTDSFCTQKKTYLYFINKWEKKWKRKNALMVSEYTQNWSVFHKEVREKMEKKELTGGLCTRKNVSVLKKNKRRNKREKSKWRSPFTQKKSICISKK